MIDLKRIFACRNIFNKKQNIAMLYKIFFLHFMNYLHIFFSYLAKNGEVEVQGRHPFILRSFPFPYHYLPKDFYPWRYEGEGNLIERIVMKPSSYINLLRASQEVANVLLVVELRR